MLSLIVLLCTLFSSSAFAKTKNENILNGQWSWEPTIDPVPPFEGYRIHPDGTKEYVTTSPFTSDNIIDEKDLKNPKIKTKKTGEVSSQDWWSGNYYYEYVPGSYSQSSSSYDSYHYLAGQTQAYNGTSSPAKLQYKQENSATHTWSVSEQISITAGLETNYLSSLQAQYGTSFASSSTTTASTAVLYEIWVQPGMTGWIKAWHPGGYSGGTADFKEYYYNYYTGTFTATGFYWGTYEQGWSPVNDGTVLNFTSGEY